MRIFADQFDFSFLAFVNHPLWNTNFSSNQQFASPSSSSFPDAISSSGEPTEPQGAGFFSYLVPPPLQTTRLVLADERTRPRGYERNNPSAQHISISSKEHTIAVERPPARAG